jgi:hypothetical protein
MTEVDEIPLAPGQALVPRQVPVYPSCHRRLVYPSVGQVRKQA